MEKPGQTPTDFSLKFKDGMKWKTLTFLYLKDFTSWNGEKKGKGFHRRMLGTTEHDSRKVSTMFVHSCDGSNPPPRLSILLKGKEDPLLFESFQKEIFKFLKRYDNFFGQALELRGRIEESGWSRVKKDFLEKKDKKNCWIFLRSFGQDNVETTIITNPETNDNLLHLKVKRNNETIMSVSIAAESIMTVVFYVWRSFLNIFEETNSNGA